MHILAIQHVAIEGLGIFQSMLEQDGAKVSSVDLSAGKTLSVHPQAFQAIISLGGPMNVYEEDKHPFLREENLFIQEVLKQQIPFLGICLGSQLLAKAAGARVQRLPREEIGVHGVQLTPKGQADVLFRGLEDAFSVFQWHEDTFQIPAQGVCLASSGDCPHQALRVGPCAYGLQFHVEVTQQMMQEWIQTYWKVQDVNHDSKSQNMVEEFVGAQSQLHRVATQIFSNFIALTR